MPRRPSRRLTRAVTCALAVTALGAPAAAARPIDAIRGTSLPTPRAASSPQADTPTVIHTLDNGFDWGSAGIGAAAAAAAIVLVAIGGVRASSRAGITPSADVRRRTP